jgi:hypothetical protein
MAQLSGFWNTGGATGDQQTAYTESHWATALKILAGSAGFEGVASNFKNALAGTVTGVNTVSINTGGAVVDGKWYHNDSALSVNIPSASGTGNTRIDRIVLRCSWSGYDVSIYRIAGTDAASPSAPALTQTSGSTYDIPLYQALVDTAGTVTLTDERTLALPEVDDVTLEIANGAIQVKEVDSAQIAPDAINGSKIANDSIDSEHYVDGSIDEAHIANGAVATAKIGDAQVTNVKLADPNDILYLQALGSAEALELSDGLIYHFVPDTHGGKTVVKLFAGITGAVSTSGTVSIRFYDVTGAVTIGTVSISQGNRTGVATVSYSLVADRLIRIDCTGAGTGVTGLDVYMKVDKS